MIIRLTNVSTLIAESNTFDLFISPVHALTLKTFFFILLSLRNDHLGPSIRPFVRPSIRPSVRLSVRPFARPSVLKILLSFPLLNEEGMKKDLNDT